MIIDTDFIIDVLNGVERALGRSVELDRDGVPERVPAPVYYELFIGAGYTDSPDDELPKIEGVVGSKPYVPMTEGIARKAGHLKGQLKAAGDDVGIGDTKIGATAIVLDEPVLTRNTDDFE